MTESSIISFLLLLLILVAVIFYLYFWPAIKQGRIYRRPFPAPWRKILRQRLSIYRHLPPDTQRQLQNLIKEFLQDKRFVGCAGQVIDDEVRLVIAAQACLLLLNRSTSKYRSLRSILVYPSVFMVAREERDEAGVVSDRRHVLSGESWSDGKVVLAWDEVARSVADFHDGHNVVLHEFAHQLDSEHGPADGAPTLSSRNAYKSWSSAFAEEFATLQQQAHVGQRSLLDHYGASNPAEFFAVATETFFEKPREMRQQHAVLYKELKSFYCVDPAQWLDERTVHGG